MKRTILLAMALATPAAHAQDAAMRNMASACAICHGTDGRAATKDVVPLAGLPATHIATQMRAFRDGHAYDHVMFGRVDPERLREWMAQGRR